jgi:hypothetical protein
MFRNVPTTANVIPDSPHSQKDAASSSSSSGGGGGGGGGGGAQQQQQQRVNARRQVRRAERQVACRSDGPFIDRSMDLPCAAPPGCPGPAGRCGCCLEGTEAAARAALAKGSVFYRSSHWPDGEARRSIDLQTKPTISVLRPRAVGKSSGLMTLTSTTYTLRSITAAGVTSNGSLV